MISTDRHELDPLTLALNGRALIEASAGTGKTFTIAFLYVRLVLGHGAVPEQQSAGVLPPNILVVTFTEAATKELRDRIRARLMQAASVFSEQALEPTADTDMLFQLRDHSFADPQTWPECRKKLLLAAEWMDEAAVSTIHSWCHRMLSEHAFDSGSLFRLSLETDQSELLLQAAQDYWRTFVYPLPLPLIDEVLSLWSQPEALMSAVRPLLGKLQQPTPERELQSDLQDIIADVTEQRQQAVQALKAYPWQQWQTEVEELLAQLKDDKRLHGASRNAMLKSWPALLEWVESAQLLPAGLEKAGLTNQTPQGLEKILKGEGEAPQHPAFNAIAELQALAAQMPTAKAAMLAHACSWISQRLEFEKCQHAQMSFDDLLTRLDDALQGGRGSALAATIRRQFPVALIDEFQDTDPVQYRIFDTVYDAEHQNTNCLLMIGDPKQAIYGFRGADIYTYLQARRSAEQTTYTLATNYRSAAGMVDAVNTVFEYAEQHRPEGAFLVDREGLPFTAVKAHGRPQQWWCDEQPAAQLTFWLQASDDGKELAKGVSQQQMADSCANEIARLLQLGQQHKAGFRSGDDVTPLQPQDIAVLVNNRIEAHSIRSALSDRGVKSVYLSDRDSVLHCSEAFELLTWLRACAEPRVLSYLRAALATPTLARSWQQLDALLSDESELERIIETFIHYQQLWQRQGVLPMLRHFLMEFDVPARLLAQDDGERRLTDILHLAELLQQDSQQLEGEHALLRHFRQLLNDANSEQEHRTLRLESDAGLVKVVTVHKSKGLEYPLVFLPFATSARPLTQQANMLQYHDDDGQLKTVLDPSAEIAQQADQERLAEDVRKLYVALTRARFATWVGAAEVKDWRHSALGYLLAPADLAQGLADLCAQQSSLQVLPMPQEEATVYQPAAEMALGPARVAQRTVKENWWISSYSALEYTARAGHNTVFALEFEDAYGQNLTDEYDQVVDAPEQPKVQARWHQFPRGAEAGTFLHDILEWCATQGFANVVADPAALQQQLQKRCQSRGWQVWESDLQRWITLLLTQPLPIGDGSVSLAQLNGYQAEMEFWFESSSVSLSALDQSVSAHTLQSADRPQIKAGQLNGMVKGFIDLVFEHQQRFYVLDYKSNVLGEQDLDYNLVNMANMILNKRYDLQFVLYVLALHRLLKVRLPDYDYQRHMGGAVYFFLRGVQAPGHGVFAHKPEQSLIESLDQLFAGVPLVPEKLSGSEL
ncbi:exodeoxyribonuclease V subunit beta [Bacterioplanes sanyensis]|uniref:RecBCD enzyme subunit RecB n=1 Tax=Bacterioplanes sanyensis TaxID=1249553 RepID=A0A222FKY4_9GAMM|nr:exodeoxyribonuclease V subunit beta [Bacterioplanes sanyensis]ASP39322.1 exodeoxyribonuclease V subunit beta [Bacterioplanes sanyensis]